MAAKRIKIDLQVDGRKGTKDFKKATSAMKKDLKGLEAQAKTSGEGIVAGFSKAKAGMLAAGAALVIIGKKFFDLTNQTATLVDNMAKFSKRLGINVKELDKLRKVGEKAGVGFSKLSMSMQRMTRRVQEAAVGSGEAQEALKELGVSADELVQLAPEEQLKVIADAFADLNDPTREAALAMKLFDSEGVAMLQMLPNLRRELEGVTSAMSPERVAAFETYKDTMAEFNFLMQDLAITFLPAIIRRFNELEPILQKITKILGYDLQAEIIESKDRIKELNDELARTSESKGMMPGRFSSIMKNRKEFLETEIAAEEKKLALMEKQNQKLDEQKKKRGELLGKLKDTSREMKEIMEFTLGYVDPSKPLPLPEEGITDPIGLIKSLRQQLVDLAMEADRMEEIRPFLNMTANLGDLEARIRMVRGALAEFRAEVAEDTAEKELQEAAIKRIEKWIELQAIAKREAELPHFGRALEEMSQVYPSELDDINTTSMKEANEELARMAEEARKAENAASSLGAKLMTVMGVSKPFAQAWADAMKDVGSSAKSAADIMSDTFDTAMDKMSDGIADLVFNWHELKKEYDSSSDMLKDYAGKFLKSVGEMILQALILSYVKRLAGLYFAEGGVAQGGFQAFAAGGVVNKPTIGLVGEGRQNEAIVPLPDGKSIPVDMKGAGQSMTTNINITMEGNGNGDDYANREQAQQLATVVEQQMDEWAVKNYRPGGLFNQGVR